MAIYNSISQDTVRQLFNYDEITGVLTWKVNKSDKAKIGVIAGHIHPFGYRWIRINNKRFTAHRVAWIYVYGEIQDHIQIDHINGNRADNRLVNLRLATRSENACNIQKARSHNKLGILGVHFRKDNKKFRAVIKVNGKIKNLGQFDTAEEAGEAYLKAKRELHPFCTI